MNIKGLTAKYAQFQKEGYESILIVQILKDLNNIKEAQEMIIHKKGRIERRKTACGISYDTLLYKAKCRPHSERISLFFKRVKGHWRTVTCKKCLRYKK